MRAALRRLAGEFLEDLRDGAMDLATALLWAVVWLFVLTPVCTFFGSVAYLLFSE